MSEKPLLIIPIGTNAWDTTCSKALSLVLSSALSARAGDVARSQLYEGAEYLHWKHVAMKLVTKEDGTKVFVAQITITAGKGFKDDLSKNLKVRLESHSEPEDFIICPIKWLLILALRTSVVVQTNIRDLTEAVDKLHNKSLVWQTPDRPVLCALKGTGGELDLEKPAPAKQLLGTLKLGCDLIGMLPLPVTHDMRRGAAVEFAHFPK